MVDKTTDKQPTKGFQPGVSGNPAGRPKGARSKLGEDFLRTLQEDFATHGKAALETVRQERPQDYIKVVASILPKEIEHSGAIETMSKEQRDAAVAAAARADG